MWYNLNKMNLIKQTQIKPKRSVKWHKVKRHQWSHKTALNSRGINKTNAKKKRFISRLFDGEGRAALPGKHSASSRTRCAPGARGRSGNTFIHTLLLLPPPHILLVSPLTQQPPNHPQNLYFCVLHQPAPLTRRFFCETKLLLRQKMQFE